MTIQKTVFISYRRANSFTARAVYQDLVQHGYDVFMDVERMDSGAFDQILLRQVEARAHFIIVLTPSALERCVNSEDWLRREIEHAMLHKRNIIPLMFEDFDFGKMSGYLTADLSTLPSYHGIRVPHDFFEEAMSRLRNRFLNVSLDMVIHPTPLADRAAFEQQQQETARQPTVTENQMTAEEYYERGNQYYESQFYDRAIEDYTDAIRLNSYFANAFNNRGSARNKIGDLEGSIADYDEVLHLDPRNAYAYNNRGLTRHIKQDYDRAIADFSEALHLNPNFAYAYNNRGNVHQEKGNLDNAIVDHNEAIRLDPHNADYYRNRGVAKDKKGDLMGANADFQKYIDLARAGVEAEKVRGWIRDNEEEMQRKGF